MKLAISRFLMTVWMPMIFLAIVCLFLYGVALKYWLLVLPFLLVLAFMTTLAEIHDGGETVHVQRWWGSIALAKEDVAERTPFFLEGIGVLKLRRFVFPWGRIYFVDDWSDVGEPRAGAEKKQQVVKPSIFTALASFVLAVSGFLAARAISSNVLDFSIKTPAMRIEALTVAGVLCIIFTTARKRNPSFANVALFMATLITGFVHW